MLSINWIYNAHFKIAILHYSEWTELFPYDFRDERMMRHLKDLTQQVVNIYPELRKDVGIIMHNLIGKVYINIIFCTSLIAFDDKMWKY